MYRYLIVLALALPLVAQVGADQAPWGPVTGRTSIVQIVHESGDVRATVWLNVILPFGSNVSDATVEHLGWGIIRTTIEQYVPPGNPFREGPIQIAGNCQRNGDPVCVGLLQASPTCNFAALNPPARAAITSLLGPCQRTCIETITTHPLGALVVVHNWRCVDPKQARCVMMAGMLVNARIDVFDSGNGCQF